MIDPLEPNILNDDESDTDTSSSTLSSFSSVSTTRDALEELDLALNKTCPFTFSKYTFQEIVPSSDIKPKPRSGHRIVHYRGRIYSFGGYNPLIDGNDPDMEADQFWAQSKPLFKELWELNLSTRQWTKCVMRGEVPEQLASHTAIIHPGHPATMIIYGGTGAPFGLTTSNTVVTCDLDTQTFSQLELDETDFGHGWPMPLYGQAVTSDNGRMFTVGGTSGFTYFMDVHMLDFRESPPRWSCLYRLSGVRDEPEPRYRHELALWEDKLYVLGGGTSFSANRFEDLPTFCVSEKRWYYTRTKPDPHATIDNSDDGYPEARRCHSAVQIKETVWIFGGYDGEEVYGDVWQLNLDTRQWTRSTIDLPIPVYFHAMTVTGEGKMIMFGGVDDIESNTRTSAVYTSWLRIPSLRTLSWEAVCHYRPGLASVPASSLVREGVPRDCVELLASADTTSQAVWG